MALYLCSSCKVAHRRGVVAESNEQRFECFYFVPDGPRPTFKSASKSMSPTTWLNH